MITKVATATAILLSLGAPAAFAATSSTPLETGVVNQIKQLDSSIAVPDLNDGDLAFLKSVLGDDADNWEKTQQIKLYFSGM